MMCGERSSRAVGCFKNGCLLLLSALMILAAPLTSWSQGLTPESARVRAMVDKGIKYLNSYTSKPQTGKTRSEDHMGDIGGRVLRALAIAKYHDVYKIPGGKTNPHVASALAECRAASKTTSKLYGKTGDLGDQLYAAALALIFLCEVDPKGSKVEIAAVTDFLIKHQMGNGAWTYVRYQKLGYGDVSQTQYVVLALWSAKQVGAYVPEEVITKACGWLMRTQEGAGSWGYQPKVDGGKSQPHRSDNPPLSGAETPDQVWYSNHNTAPSLAAAGLSSMYITAGMLQFVPAEPVAIVEKKKSVSSILKIKEEKKELKPLTNALDAGRLKNGLQRGDAWFNRNGLSAKCRCNSGRDKCGGKDHYPYYYLYVYERYCTFRDLANRLNDPSPGWYQQGVNYLDGKQNKKDGSWQGVGKNSMKIGPAVATSFAIFFLIRSTQKSVGKLAQKTDFQGGRGLPQDTTAARFQGSKVLGSPIGGDIDSLLGLLEDVDNPKFDNMVALPPELVLSKDQKQRNSQVAKLEKVIRSGSYEARRIAVQNLARAQGMDSVPILIFALSDPDETVMKAARDALRFVSRKINGFGLPDKATDPERARAQQNWRNWYRSVRPDVKLD